MNESLENELSDIKKQGYREKLAELTQKLKEYEQMHNNLLEKQAKREQEYLEEKNTQEKDIKEKIDDYEMRMRLLKSKFSY